MTPESSKIIFGNHMETLEHCKVLLKEGKPEIVKVLLNLVSKNIKNLEKKYFSHIIKKKDMMNFNGYVFDCDKMKLFGYTEPQLENRLIFEVDIKEYPITNECVIHNRIIVP